MGFILKKQPSSRAFCGLIPQRKGGRITSWKGKVIIMKKVRIGIVGAGNIATNAHMPAYAACDKAEVVAVADLNLERAEAFAKRFGIPHAYASVEELLANEDIDAVDVCTWNNGHALGACARSQGRRGGGRRAVPARRTKPLQSAECAGS